MTDKELEELEALAKAATPGPWEWNRGLIKEAPPMTLEANGRELIHTGEYTSPNWPTAKYIAALSPDVCLKLIDTVRKLQEEVLKAGEEIELTYSESI